MSSHDWKGYGDDISRAQDENLMQFTQTANPHRWCKSSLQCPAVPKTCSSGSCRHETFQDNSYCSKNISRENVCYRSCSRGISLSSKTNQDTRKTSLCLSMLDTVSSSCRPCGRTQAQPKPCATVSVMPPCSANRLSQKVSPCKNSNSRFQQRPACRSRLNLCQYSSGTSNTCSLEDPTDLRMGMCVRILAVSDVRQPSSRDCHIPAVVLYKTPDGQYKVGTRLGVIGQLFAKEELKVTDKTLLKIKDVPNRNINLREASTLSY